MQNLLKEMGSEREQRWQRLLGPRSRHGANLRRVRPESFHFAYLIVRPMPYRHCDARRREASTGGVLQAGQTVWLEKPLAHGGHRRPVTGFTDTAGMVKLDARGLAVVRG